MPTSVRLDAKTEALVVRLAHKTGRTKSEVIRTAIARLAEAEAAPASATTPYEAMEHLLGVARGGPPRPLRPDRREGPPASPGPAAVILVDAGPLRRTPCGRSS